VQNESNDKLSIPLKPKLPEAVVRWARMPIRTAAWKLAVGERQRCEWTSHSAGGQ